VPGFYPAGGGEFTARITPTMQLSPVSLTERGELKARRVHVYLVHLPSEIGKREVALLTKHFAPDEILPPVNFPSSTGPGNVILIERIHEHVTEIVSSFGEKGVSAELVVDRAVKAYREYHASGAVVGEHLADQLLIPFALAGGGEFLTLRPSRHALTNIQTIAQFIDQPVGFHEESETTWRCVVGK